MAILKVEFLKNHSIFWLPTGPVVEIRWLKNCWFSKSGELVGPFFFKKILHLCSNHMTWILFIHLWNEASKCSVKIKLSASELGNLSKCNVNNGIIPGQWWFWPVFCRIAISKSLCSLCLKQAAEISIQPICYRKHQSTGELHLWLPPSRCRPVAIMQKSLVLTSTGLMFHIPYYACGTTVQSVLSGNSRSQHRQSEYRKEIFCYCRRNRRRNVE